MKFIKTLLVIIVAAVFTGCGNFVEEIHLKEDGTGTYKMYSDVIPASVEMAVQMTMMFSGLDTANTYNEDSLRLAMTEKVWEDFPETVDSTFSITEEVPENLRNDPKNKKYLEGAQGFMKGGRAEGEVNMGMAYNFSDAADFQGFVTFMEETQQNSGSANGGPADALTKTKTTATYQASKKGFSRKVVYVNPQDLEDENLGKMAAMMGDNGTYQTVVITERKIKKVHGENVKSVEDYKVVFEYDFIKAMTGNLNTDFEIIFE